jgi:uncharacterized lipoprotein
MRFAKHFLLFSSLALLSACGTLREEALSESELLERPPLLAATPTPVDQEVLARSSEEPKKLEKGLGNEVSINSESPFQIRIKRSFDVAWHDLELVFKQKELEVTDREHDKHQYYVTFDADDYQPEDSGFFAKSTSLFRNDYKPAVYVVSLEDDGSGETRISAALANEAEQTSHDNKGGDLTDGADKLLLFLYKSLRDDLVED